MRLFDWIFAARPLLHVPGWSIYLVGLHYHHELARQTFAWADAGVLFGLSLLAAGGFYFNQVADQESDRANRKCLYLANGVFSPGQFVAAFIICSVIAIGLSVLISPVTLMIFAQLFVLMYLYSARPFRLKDRPLGGLFVNAYGNGFLVAIAVMPEIGLHNAGLLGWDNPFYFLFAVGGTYVLTTIPDMAGDRLASKNTAALVFGRVGALLVAVVLFAAAAWVGFGDGRVLLGSIAIGAATICSGAFLTRSAAVLMVAIKLPIIGLALLAAWFYPAYLAFLVVCIFATRVYYRKRFGTIYPQLAA